MFCAVIFLWAGSALFACPVICGVVPAGFGFTAARSVPEVCGISPACVTDAVRWAVPPACGVVPAWGVSPFWGVTVFCTVFVPVLSCCLFAPSSFA